MLSRGWTRATARNSQYMVATPRTSRQTEGWGRTKGPFLGERWGEAKAKASGAERGAWVAKRVSEHAGCSWA